MNVSSFIDRHFRHFNAGATRAAAAAYADHIDRGGRMFLSLAGAMSTAELGLSLAEMIRRDKIHAISCTGANLEEDLFNLVAHADYRPVPNYRELSPADESAMARDGYCRVTDVAIPEERAFRRIEAIFLDELKQMVARGEPMFPHEILYRMILDGRLEGMYQIDPADSWLVAAARKELPLFVPGWEDSTLGNFYAARLIDGALADGCRVRSGMDYMASLVRWYREGAGGRSAAKGFFQIGGGIAGDFAICVVPLISRDLGQRDIPTWKYYCQITDSTTSYGSYSGATPNEKITWGKLDPGVPRFFIESDATIVAPLIFAHVLGW